MSATFSDLTVSPKSNLLHLEPPSMGRPPLSGPMTDPPATRPTPAKPSPLSDLKAELEKIPARTSNRLLSPPKTGVSSVNEILPEIFPISVAGSASPSIPVVIPDPVQILALGLPKGAWAAPPFESNSRICSGNGNHTTELNSLAQWLSLAVSNNDRTKQSQTRESGTHSGCESGNLVQKLNFKAATTASLLPPLVQEEEKQRFPWAARMNPSMRNLYRATSPTYMEDGTPKVSIPSHVLLKGLENQKEFILGHFYRCSTPSGGLIHAVVNRIWGRKCKIFIRKLGESSYLFHIPDESTRSWVLQRGLWHVDECLMFVAPWSPTSTLSMPEISTVPVWVTLKNIPNQLYSISGISYIASGLGAPMSTYKPRLDPTLMGEAKIMVEVELDKPFPQRIVAADNKGSISMVDVVYSWIPTKCGRCGHLGHKESRCLQHLPKPLANTTLGNLQANEAQDSETSSKTKVITSIACLSTSEITPISVSNLDAAIVSLPFIEATNTIAIELSTDLEASVVPSIEDISTTPIVEVTLQDLESPTVVELLPHTSKSHEVVDVTVSPLDVQYLETTFSGNKTTPLAIEPNICGTKLRVDGTITTPESSDTDVDVMTPSSQRILRERPVQPTLKYNEDEWISISSHRRGKRSRGGRRGRYG